MMLMSQPTLLVLTFVIFDILLFPFFVSNHRMQKKTTTRAPKISSRKGGKNQYLSCIRNGKTLEVIWHKSERKSTLAGQERKEVFFFSRPFFSFTNLNSNPLCFCVVASSRFRHPLSRINALSLGKSARLKLWAICWFRTLKQDKVRESERNDFFLRGRV